VTQRSARLCDVDASTLAAIRKSGGVIVHCAVIGRHGSLPIETECEINGSFVRVGHKYAKQLQHSHAGLKLDVDVSDCTTFRLIHYGKNLDLNSPDAEAILEILDDSLLAISELILWQRLHTQVGEHCNYQRRIGRIDVKFFGVEKEGKLRIVWLSPLFNNLQIQLSSFGNMFTNAIMINGPASSPTTPDLRRLMASIDLINLGFFTEAFVTAFALLDDLVQRVVSGGLLAKGFSSKENADFIRAIKEERLNHYLNSALKLCGWVNLRDENPTLNAKMLKVNALRNKVMHGDRELLRSESLEGVGVAWTLIDFLRNNPFGVPITGMPPQGPATPQLTLVPDTPLEELGEQDKSGDQPDSE
jgi:hypothetical protein